MTMAQPLTVSTTSTASTASTFLVPQQPTGPLPLPPNQMETRP